MYFTCKISVMCINFITGVIYSSDGHARERESSFGALNEPEQRQESNSRKRSCQVNRCLCETSTKM